MGRKKIDLTGQRFGVLVVLRECEERSKGGKILVECICDCGNKTTKEAGNLRIGSTRSCGCGQFPSLDITGQRFGKLTAIRSTEKRINRNVIWECLCDCGKKTEVTANRLKRGTKSCGCNRNTNPEGKRYGRLLVTGRASKRENNRVAWNCLCDCGTTIEVVTNSLTSGNTKSCGCFRLEIWAKQIGENNPNYNPKLTDEERLKNRYRMKDRNYNVWSKLVKERDNYTCQTCGDNQGRKLNSHHLNGWNAFPEQRFDLDNGVTLCTDCHKDFHSQYGYGDNTREQFDEYAASKTLVLN